MAESSSGERRANFLLGAAHAFSLLTMFAGAFAAAAAATKGDLVAVGVCLLAVGVAAGLALNACLRQ